MPMREADYWEHLEYRVCRELRGLAQTALLSLRCNGFIPERYILDDPTPRVEGRVWIGVGSSSHQEWEFALLLPHPVRSRDEITWAALLPPEHATRWLALDLIGMYMHIEPAAALSGDAGT